MNTRLRDEQLVAVAENLIEPHERSLDPIGEVRRQVMGHAADPAPCHGDSRAGHRLDQVVEKLARLHHVERDGRRADLLRCHPQARQVVGDARNFAHDQAHVLASLSRVDAEQALDGECEADVVDARRGVIEAVGVGEALRPGPLLAHLFESAMQESDLDVAIDDPLAVELEVELDGAVGGGMRRAHLQFHDLVGGVRRYDFILPARR